MKTLVVKCPHCPYRGSVTKVSGYVQDGTLWHVVRCHQCENPFAYSPKLNKTTLRARRRTMRVELTVSWNPILQRHPRYWTFGVRSSTKEY